MNYFKITSNILLTEKVNKEYSLKRIQISKNPKMNLHDYLILNASIKMFYPELLYLKGLVESEAAIKALLYKIFVFESISVIN